MIVFVLVPIEYTKKSAFSLVFSPIPPWIPPAFQDINWQAPTHDIDQVQYMQIESGIMDKQKSYCDDIACGKSCWQEASEKIRVEDPKLYKQLEEMLATQKRPICRADISNQIAQSIEASKNRTQDRNVPFPWKNRNEGDKARVRKAMDSIPKAVIVFRNMGSAAASLDPLHVGVAWAGANLILQVPIYILRI